MKLIISTLLNIKSIRCRVLHYLRNYYFHEFRHSIPLDNDFWAHLLEIDAYDSFSEIFIKQEYLTFIPNEPIYRILDIGAHYGYFSLWFQSINPKIELTSLLIEPSPRCYYSLKNLTKQKKLSGRFSYMQGAVGSVDCENALFYDRPYMAGSVYSKSPKEKAIQVPIFSESDITKKYSPPYDLIKCDIEGSEFEFLSNYQSLVKETKFLLIEWHSWHNGGEGYSQIKQKIKDLKFDIIKSSSSQPAVGRTGEVGLLLAKNSR